MTLVQSFKKEVLPRLQQELKKANRLEVPVFQKVVINTGLGTPLKVNRDFDWMGQDLALLSGQKPVLKKARQSISNFKLRAGQPNGLMVTLRGRRMYDFLDRLIGVTLPRVLDFKGFPVESFDGRGNFTFGLKEHLVFPEVKPNEYNRTFSLEITVVTTAKNNAEGQALLRAIGFPLRK